MFGSYKLLNMVQFLAHLLCETIQSSCMWCRPRPTAGRCGYRRTLSL